MKNYAIKLTNVETGEIKLFNSNKEALNILKASSIEAMMAYKNNYPLNGYYVDKREKVSEYSIKLNTPVKNITTGKRFENMYIAAHYYRKKNPYDILYAIENNRKTVGCVWDYARKPDMSPLVATNEEKIEKHTKKGQGKKRPYKVPVIDLSTGIIYESTMAASLKLGISNGSMYEMLNGRKDSHKGHRMRVLEDCKLINLENGQITTAPIAEKEITTSIIETNVKEEKNYNVSLENAAMFFGMEKQDLINFIESEYGLENEDFKPIYKVDSFEMTKEGFDKIFDYINTL